MEFYTLMLLMVRSAIISFHFIVLTNANSCERFIRQQQVSFSTSDCSSLETYIPPKPTHLCVLKCQSIPGCIAIGSNSVHMTTTCCTLVEQNINIMAGNSVIIHQSDYKVCVGSDWTGKFLTPYPASKSDITFTFRFNGLAQNCSQFTGKVSISSTKQGWHI